MPQENNPDPPTSVPDSSLATWQDDFPAGWPTPTLDFDTFKWQFFSGWVRAHRPGKTRVWMWKHGYDIEKATDPSKRRWACHHCHEKHSPQGPYYCVVEGMQNAKSHLWEKHCIWDYNDKRPPPLSSSQPPRGQATLTSMLGLNATVPREQQIASTLIGGFNKIIFQQMLLCFIICSNLSFRLIDNPILQAIFRYLNPLVETTNACFTSSTLRRRIVSTFTNSKQAIVDVLAKVDGQIHVAFDGWRSRNRKSLYGIVIFWVDHTTAKIQKLVLGMPEMKENHTGENIAEHVVDVLKFFGIEKKVGFFTLDNAGKFPKSSSPLTACYI